MKTKLALKSETLRRLDIDTLDAIRGGIGDNNTQGNTNTQGTNNTGGGDNNKTSCWINFGGKCC